MRKQLVLIFVLLIFIIISLTSCGEKKCETCDGSGKDRCVMWWYAEYSGTLHSTNCTYCDGDSWIKCSDCNGSGVAS